MRSVGRQGGAVVLSRPSCVTDAVVVARQLLYSPPALAPPPAPPLTQEAQGALVYPPASRTDPACSVPHAHPSHAILRRVVRVWATAATLRRRRPDPRQPLLRSPRRCPGEVAQSRREGGKGGSAEFKYSRAPFMPESGGVGVILNQIHGWLPKLKSPARSPQSLTSAPFEFTSTNKTTANQNP